MKWAVETKRKKKTFSKKEYMREKKDILEKNMIDILCSDKYENNQNESYETDSFDIYNPNNTIETFSS